MNYRRLPEWHGPRTGFMGPALNVPFYLLKFVHLVWWGTPLLANLDGPTDERKERRTIYLTWLEFLNPGLSVGYFAHFGNERLVEETVPTPLASYLLMRREPAVLEPMRFPRDTVQLVGKLITSKQIAIIHRFVSLQRTNKWTGRTRIQGLDLLKNLRVNPGIQRMTLFENLLISEIAAELNSSYDTNVMMELLLDGSTFSFLGA